MNNQILMFLCKIFLKILRTDQIIFFRLQAFMSSLQRSLNRQLTANIRTLVSDFKLPTYSAKLLEYHNRRHIFQIFRKYLSNQNVSIILYDHNQNRQLRGYMHKVSRVIDHHAVKKDHMDYFQKLRGIDTLIYPTGSALTLLFYIINQSSLKIDKVKDPLISKSTNQGIFYDYEMDNPQQQFLLQTISRFKVRGSLRFKDQSSEKTIMQLIINGIYLDCHDSLACQFDKSCYQKRKRCTFADFAVFQKIKQKYKIADSHEQLIDLKFSVEKNLKLSLNQHLEKDKKTYVFDLTNKDKLNEAFFLEYGQCEQSMGIELNSRKDRIQILQLVLIIPVVLMHPIQFLQNYEFLNIQNFIKGDFQRYCKRKQLNQGNQLNQGRQLHCVYIIMFVSKIQKQVERFLMIVETGRFNVHKAIKNYFNLEDYGPSLVTEQQQQFQKKKKLSRIAWLKDKKATLTRKILHHYFNS